MSDKTDWKFDDLEKHERGEIARHAFFKHQEKLGNTFTRATNRHNLYYRRACDSVILGITYSENKSDSWFFNLRENFFQEAVFLCQSGPRAVRAVHLPTQFLDNYLRHLSRRESTARGKTFNEVLFHFSKDGQRWLFHVPEPVGKQDVTKFTDTVELVCDRYALLPFA